MLDTRDDQLLARIAGGDQAAMRSLFTAQHLRVHRYVLRLVRREDVAEDVVTEVFLDVWRQAARFEGRSSVTTWLLSIARFKAYSALRRRTEAPLDEEFAETIEDLDDTPEVTLQKSDKAGVLRACIDRLSPEHREAIDLVYYQEQSIEDVSRIVGIPENTVKTRVFHARKRLSELCREAGLDRGWP
ncbi:RNA polymerase sigma factor [Kaistia sp. 32K]|uniref:sigma-70 family RNA polymerase sigma factor n=1 Tax=Kaistia sp. 32K TaxID=2795690 RepID=UPI0019155D7F|nr:sigma-70 family RNA polymerase sigma factor [Kaistia sp. 32K]BCP52659.1 RNA polymerase sigma factor [Kaistia sp. 32K]